MTDNDKLLSEIKRISEREAELHGQLQRMIDRWEAQAAEIERTGQRILMWLGAYRDGLSEDAIADLQSIARAALEETLHVAKTCKENGETFT
jgi:hypothetical protein